MESQENLEIISENCKKFLQFIRKFETTKTVDNVLIIQDDFAFYNWGGQDKKRAFNEAARRSGLMSETQNINGGYKIVVNLPVETDGIKTVEYHLIKDY